MPGFTDKQLQDIRKALNAHPASRGLIDRVFDALKPSFATQEIHAIHDALDGSAATSPITDDVIAALTNPGVTVPPVRNTEDPPPSANP